MTPDHKRNVLVFGSSGQIGRAIVAQFASEDWNVTAVSRGGAKIHASDVVDVACDPFELSEEQLSVALAPTRSPFDAVVWAQGVNLNDSLTSLDWSKHLEVLKANCLYVTFTLSALLKADLLSRAGARLCFISSIWQTRARQQKFSYIVSKAALQGVVLSAAADLAEHGHLVNAVLPGALKTPMTESVLSPDQIAALASATRFGRLANLSDVCDLVSFLCSTKNTSITGQFISVDLGYQNVRIV